MKIFTLILSLWLGLSASGETKGIDHCTPKTSALLLPGNPQGFAIYRDKSTLWVQSRGQLYAREQKALEGCPQVKLIPAEVKKIVVLSSTYLPWIDDLGLGDKVVGITSKSYVASPKIHQRLSKGQAFEVGLPASAEKVLSLNPDLVITYRAVDEEIEGISKLHSLKLNVLELDEFSESNPIARGSWILFLAALLGDEEDFEAARKLWQKRIAAYEKYRASAQELEPVKVIVGSFGENAWHAPPGDSDLATLLKDARADYAFAGIKKGEVVVFEKVLHLSSQAKVWITQNQWTDKGQILKEDARYKLLLPFKNNQIYNYSKNKKPGQGFDYWESGIARPDLILRDLILILHPGHLKEKETKWYQKLE